MYSEAAAVARLEQEVDCEDWRCGWLARSRQSATPMVATGQAVISHSVTACRSSWNSHPAQVQVAICRESGECETERCFPTTSVTSCSQSRDAGPVLAAPHQKPYTSTYSVQNISYILCARNIHSITSPAPYPLSWSGCSIIDHQSHTACHVLALPLAMDNVAPVLIIIDWP